MEKAVEGDKAQQGGRSHRLVLKMGAELKMSNRQMTRLRNLNRDYRLERNRYGDLEIRPAMAEQLAWQLSRFFLSMVNWAMGERIGLAFEAGTAYALPNGSLRLPDISWVRKSRLVRLAVKKKAFDALPLAPDFALLVCHRGDDLQSLRAKMSEFLENGTELGWLLDLERRNVYVHQKGEPELMLKDPSSISGAPLLSGFSFHPSDFWDL